MKKYICIFAGAALLVACQQKTETIAPASPTPTPETPEASETPGTAAEPMTTLPPATESESVNMTPFAPNGQSSWVSPTPTP